MKKTLLILLVFFTSTLFAEYQIGVKIGGKNSISIGIEVNDGHFRSDHHRYDRKYKKFDYKRYGYFDDYGYYFGYFDKFGYFYNNIFFSFNSKYTYRDRVRTRGYFSHNRPHFRPYQYQKNNNWNKKHKFRKRNQKIYGHYYDNDIKKKNKYKRDKRDKYDRRKYDNHDRDNRYHK